MSLTATSLSAASSAGAKFITLTSATGIAKNMLVQVDGESMLVTSVDLSPTIGVVPGYAGTANSAHAILAPAVFGYPIDFVTQASGSFASGGGQQAVTSYGASGAISVPTVNTTVFLTKAGVGAMTLADPGADQQNVVTFQSLTANAHTVTNTTGFNNGGTASDVATFGGAIGDSFTVKAQSGKWNVLVLHNVTLGMWLLMAAALTTGWLIS